MIEICTWKERELGAVLATCAALRCSASAPAIKQERSP